MEPVKVFLIARRTDSGEHGGQARSARRLEQWSDKRIQVEVSGLPRRGHQGRLGRVVASLFVIGKILRARRRGFYVFHIFSPTQTGAIVEKIVFGAFARLLRGETIINFRNDFVRYYDACSGKEKWIIRRALRLFSRVLVQYEMGQKFLVENVGLTRDKVVAIPNGLGEEWLGLPKPGTSGGTKRIVFVGEIGYRKGADTVLEACNILQDTRMDFCIEFYGKIAEDFPRKHIDALSKKGYVVFHGWCQEATISGAFRDGTIFVLPSRAEGFPNSLMEAMAAGLPSVVTDRGGVTELIEEGREGFFVEEGDAGSLANRLSRLLDNDGLRKACGIAAQKKVQSICDPIRVKEMYWSVYRDLADRG